MLIKRYGRKDDYLLMSRDARNTFNTFSRQQILDLFSLRAPPLAQFIKMVNGRFPPPLLLAPSVSVSIAAFPYILHSQGGPQQGDSSSRLLFSLFLQPLIKNISQECDLYRYMWYADDVLLICHASEVVKALRLLRDFGPRYM